MDFATIIGLVVALALVIFGIVNGNGMSAIMAFLDAPSALITFGGAFGALLASMKIKDFTTGLKGILVAIKEQKYDQMATIKQIIELSNVARKEGLLALEEAASNLEDPFMKKGILLIVDGTEPDLVRGILETELSCIEARHQKVSGFWLTLSGNGPAWGMIGTLIGLVNMLKSLDDPSTIGPAMAVALITTLYGSLLANWICNPVAFKLNVDNEMEITLKEVMIEGLLSIQAGENPRVIEEKLKSFLAPADRAKYSAENGEGEPGGEQA